MATSILASPIPASQHPANGSATFIPKAREQASSAAVRNRHGSDRSDVPIIRERRRCR